ncbi:ankyrin repeat and LEM domain-containing protein 2-like isoform X1 [Scleropages formosus]|uniref:ankyrin repeat and LEM domain-containing protein 2-like isoform X1 n=1 Tax=Scleropages formosus TaxID=113540 RepID=UPI0008791D0C|nr:ankyrin repeat and LEM domain-containing protein 2-like isoform X1 [Scleropages formosus]
MESILSRLRALSPDELRAEIMGAGLKCGPITSTTRLLFEKKLALTILENQGGSDEVSDADGGTSGKASNTEKVGEEGDFGYGQGLNPPEEEALAGTVTDAPSWTAEGVVPSPRTTQEPPSLFYGVCPDEDGLVGQEDVHVYVSKNDAMKAMSRMRGARFKIYSNREDAEKFSKGICDSCPSPCKSTPDGLPEKPDRLTSPEAEPLNGERANSYKTPRTQDLTAKLRKAVEDGEQAAFKKLVWSNPRYLIGSGDNPTIVQEGCRYNVLHVAAKENQPGIAELLLDTLEDPEFMRLMYPEDEEDMLQKRIRYIVDLYLNTPDKVACETPLHFACKFGNAEVVNVLCSHPDTDKNCKNKYNQKPVSIICERKNKCKEIKQKIKGYLEDQFYVPVLRAADNSAQPVIGAPWSPEQLEAAPRYLGPGLSGSPKDPVMTVRAFVGPLSQSKARDFRRMWKTPPKERSAYFHNILKSDPDRGAERVGRELAHELGYPWAEYWEFLDTFINLSTEDGLELLEEYLSRKECGEQDLQGAKKKRNGKPRNVCNSISVGAFLDEEDGSALNLGEDILENEQNNSLSSTPGPCATDSLKEGRSEKQRRNWLCSPLEEERGPKAERLGRDHASPVSNLMNEFEKVSVLASGRNTHERGQGDSESEETCSSSSEEYFTADESDEEGICHMAGMTGTRSAFWNVAQKDPDSSCSSSSSSYKSLQSSEEDLRPQTPPRLARGPFIDGESPTKLDCEVLFEIETVEFDSQKYPCIERWKSTVQGYSPPQMQRWPSPGCAGKIPGSAPRSPSSPVRPCGSPRPRRYSPVRSVFIQSLRQNHHSKPSVWP